MFNECSREDDPLRGSQTYHLIASAKVEFHCSTDKKCSVEFSVERPKNACITSVYRLFKKNKKNPLTSQWNVSGMLQWNFSLKIKSANSDKSSRRTAVSYLFLYRWQMS